MDVRFPSGLRGSSARRPLLVDASRGQAIVLIALLMVILLGFTALAVDGGGLYVLQRRAQNAADAAMLAATYAKCNGETQEQMESRALAAAIANDMDPAQPDVSMTVGVPTSGPKTGDANYVEVIVQAQTPSYFMHFVYHGQPEVTVRAVGRCTPAYRGVAGGGNALIALNATKKDAMKLHGNGEVILTGGGGAHVNSDHNEGLRAVGNGTMSVEDGGGIAVVGCYSENGHGQFSPEPANRCDGDTVAPMADPLAHLEPPERPEGECIEIPNSWHGEYVIDPGYYCDIHLSGQGDLTLNPGLYYVRDGVHVSGQGTFTAEEVMVYIENGSYIVTGQGAYSISAPTTGDWAGMALFMGRDNPDSNSVRVTGNGGMASLNGTIYAPTVDVDIQGSPHSTKVDVFNAQVIADTVQVGGNGTLYINYDEDLLFEVDRPPTVSVVE